jgi:hypothetical protein
MDLLLTFLAPVLATIGGAAIAWRLIADSCPVRDSGLDRAPVGERMAPTSLTGWSWLDTRPLSNEGSRGARRTRRSSTIVV